MPIQKEKKNQKELHQSVDSLSLSSRIIRLQVIFFPVIYILQYFKNFVQQTCIAFNIRNINFKVLLFMHIPLKWQMSSCQIKNVDTMFGF